MTATPLPSSPPESPADVVPIWKRHGRMFVTLADQGLVSIASFATNFLLLHHFRNDPSHFASYTLAFNLMIWAAEFQSTLVFTPHTIRSPRLEGRALRQFHGSTLLHSTVVSLVTAVLTLVAAGATSRGDPAMAKVLLTLGLGTVVIGLRNYARPYAFAARRPMQALVLDLAVSVLQIGGVLLLKHFGRLEAWTAVAVVAAASAVPSLVWLVVLRHRFEPHVGRAVQDLKQEWPQTRWVFMSGMSWNAGMLLYPWLIKVVRGDVDVAVWGACYQLACVANPLLMGLQNFIGPRVAEAVTEQRQAAFRRYVFRVAGSTALLMTAPAIVLAVYANTALAWLTQGALTGQQAAIAFLCAAIVVQAVTFTLSRGLFALHRADLDLYCNSLPLLVLFTLGVAATRRYGVSGAALSLLVAQLLSASSRAVLLWRAVGVPRPASIHFDAAGEVGGMTALTFPTPLLARPIAMTPRAPWATALLLFVLFAASSWSWNASQGWYGSSENDVAALVDRISEGQTSRQVAYVIMGVFGIYLLATPGERRVRVSLWLIYPVLLFCGWAVLSVAWSIDHLQTLKRLSVFVALVLTVAGMLKHYDVRQLAQVALIASGLTMAVGMANESWILLHFAPGLGKWRFGGMMHPNHAGLNCCVVVLAANYLFSLSKNKWLLALAALGGVVLFFTKSRTALMSGMTGLAAFWLLASSAPRTLLAILLVTWTVAAGLWLQSMEMLPNVAGFVAMGREDIKHQDVSELTGRPAIWKFALMQAEKDPNRGFIGYGYETFWTPENTRGVSDFVSFKISEGHNVYLDWYLELGWVGVSLYVLILLTALTRWSFAARALASPSAAIAGALLYGTIVHGFAESSLGDASLPTMFVYASIAGAALKRPDELEPEPMELA